ncbi:MAG: hypothetical protein QW468_06285 [Candidatus Bathyarchaeia archaeon]
MKVLTAEKFCANIEGDDGDACQTGRFVCAREIRSCEGFKS